MRGRAILAASFLLCGSASFAAPASAQDVAPQTPARAEGASAADIFARSPFPQRFEFGTSNYAFSALGEDFFASANYAGVPGYELSGTAGDIVTLRDVYVSGAVLPNLRFDLARWNYAPGSYLFDTGLSSEPSAPALAGFGSASGFSIFGSSGTRIGASVGLTDEISLSFARSWASTGSAADALASPLPASVALQLGSQAAASVETSSAGLDWDVTDWAELGVTASRTQETSSVLGDAIPSVRLSTGADTVALGISARVGFGEGWVTTVAYSEGITQLDLNSNATPGFESIRNQSYGFSVAKQGLFGDDALGLSISQPLGVYGSTNFASLALSSVLNARPDTLTTRESDFTVGYVTTFMDGALALQANTTYRLNANGEQGQDAVSVLSRAQIKF